jgi:hypothetical protein
MEDGVIELDSDRGRRLGFTSDRFGGYLWKLGEYVMISMAISSERGNFRQLVEEIQSLGMGVKIPTPIGRMQNIVREAGYQQSVEFDETYGEGVEVWVLKPRSHDRVQS